MVEFRTMEDRSARESGAVRGVLRVLMLCFREARPVVQGVFLLRLLAGAFFASSVLLLEFTLMLVGGAVVWICATCAVYLYNGISDVEEDRVNGSSRPVAGGELRISEAQLVLVLLVAASLLGSVLMDPVLFWAVAVLLVLGWAYSGPPWYLKRWPARLAFVAMVAALLTYKAGYLVGGGEGLVPLMVFAGFMALWMGFVGQTKDFPDRRGDELAGRRSLPIVWGETGARVAISVVAILIGVGFLLVSLRLSPGLLLPAAITCAGAVVVSVLCLVGSAGQRGRKRPYRAFMVTQYACNMSVIALPVAI